MNCRKFFLLFLLVLLYTNARGQGFPETEVTRDTGKYYPANVCIYNCGRTVKQFLKFKLPHEKDQSGMANILFKNKNSGEIFTLDYLIHQSSPDNPSYYIRAYRAVFFSGRYDVIFLYNNGKYIKYPDVLFENNMSIDVDFTIEKSIEINAKENSWIIVMMEEDRAAVWEKAIISTGIKK